MDIPMPEGALMIRIDNIPHLRGAWRVSGALSRWDGVESCGMRFSHASDDGPGGTGYGAFARGFYSIELAEETMAAMAAMAADPDYQSDELRDEDIADWAAEPDICPVCGATLLVEEDSAARFAVNCPKGDWGRQVVRQPIAAAAA